MRADICVLRRTFLKDTDSLDVGLPHMVGPSMGMAHVLAKVGAFSADRANSH